MLIKVVASRCTFIAGVNVLIKVVADPEIYLALLGDFLDGVIVEALMLVYLFLSRAVPFR